MRKALTLVFVSLVLGACSTPEEKAARAQERAYSAQEELVKERLRLVDQYRDCVADAGDDALKVEACDSYLKSAQALQ